ncbi:hypothetical protein K4F52_006157 [Lecanicillium sp. MT-2017a]|nr:hypothetical protein K4F52_006157 [Lecanicillium sp. MT-2017a]
MYATTATTAHISPRVLIVSMFTPEAQAWHDNFDASGLGNLTAQTVYPRGLSMLFPGVYCTESGAVCQFTVGEGEINAAASMMALLLSDTFDLRSTYVFLGGIAGVNPKHATLGSVALARYAVQVALQYEVDPRSLPQNWSTGYIGYGQVSPDKYPSITYGTEVLELNAKLRDIAYNLASKATLVDSGAARRFRARYRPSFEKAAEAPTVVKCDVATSDVYYSGTMLAEAFENTTRLWTNGTGESCMSAQEDNAVLEVLVRGAIEKLVDFSRIIVMRTGKEARLPAASNALRYPPLGSDFDRPAPGQSSLEHLTVTNQNGLDIATTNLYHAGIEVVRGIVSGWNSTFRQGIAPDNYIGDIFGSLGGFPDFGLGSITRGERVDPASYRKVKLGLTSRKVFRSRRFAYPISNT